MLARKIEITLWVLRQKEAKELQQYLIKRYGSIEHWLDRFDYIEPSKYNKLFRKKRKQQGDKK